MQAFAESAHSVMGSQYVTSHESGGHADLPPKWCIGLPVDQKYLIRSINQWQLRCKRH